ncbi:hypothetical protein AGR6A_Cc180029 [Agrobacterium sp. NCPPB 925]|nr:hypothetical protein AGR6A_Cc180029 [Agrobacterium sp. NCPPB 925]
MPENSGGSGNETKYDGSDESHAHADKSRMNRIFPVAWRLGLRNKVFYFSCLGIRHCTLPSCSALQTGIAHLG